MLQDLLLSEVPERFGRTQSESTLDERDTNCFALHGKQGVELLRSSLFQTLRYKEASGTDEDSGEDLRDLLVNGLVAVQAR